MQLFHSSTRPPPRQVQTIRQRYRSLIKVHSEANATLIVMQTFSITKEVLLDIMTPRNVKSAKKIEDVDVEKPLNNRKSSFQPPKEKQCWASALRLSPCSN
jgi:hypothetical protein